jgi:hypothetical protein
VMDCLTMPTPSCTGIRDHRIPRAIARRWPVLPCDFVSEGSRPMPADPPNRGVPRSTPWS